MRNFGRRRSTVVRSKHELSTFQIRYIYACVHHYFLSLYFFQPLLTSYLRKVLKPLSSKKLYNLCKYWKDGKQSFYVTPSKIIPGHDPCGNSIFCIIGSRRQSLWPKTTKNYFKKYNRQQLRAPLSYRVYNEQNWTLKTRLGNMLYRTYRFLYTGRCTYRRRTLIKCCVYINAEQDEQGKDFINTARYEYNWCSD